jgi:hypothetical protein
LTVLLHNLGEGKNDSQFSGSLAKSSDAYFQFGYRDSKWIMECSTMSRSIKKNSLKLNKDIYKGQYFLSKRFHVNTFIFYLLCVILSAYALYKNDKFMGRPCNCLGDGQYSQEKQN